MKDRLNIINVKTHTDIINSFSCGQMYSLLLMYNNNYDINVKSLYRSNHRKQYDA